ncbi:hypothetical protein ACFPK9_15485 [Rubritalea spongiae]|uniref:Four helix bundle protein n=1 Tax=Rubritalea spongiae TaxID=430797 RepID=A0ABW5DXH0_9BACT
MKTEKPLKDKAYAFALRSIKLYQHLQTDLRTATSIGANDEEAIGAQSDKDFISK